jgi:NADPH:quinone reductase-like Zn-dependent oxidoreductase
MSTSRKNRYWVNQGWFAMNQTLDKTMKAVAIDRFGGIETLITRELPIPDVGADEVGIRVEAAGVGVWDPFEREGGFAKEFNVKPRFPLVLGSDGAGTVDAVGDNVRHFKKGDRVYGIAFLNPKGGFYSQYAVVKESSVSRIPGKLSMPQAAAMAVDAITALAGLDTTLGLKNGESVLILGASGGVGHLAVQIAKRMGARVLAVASGDDGVAFVRGLGADMVVDGKKDDIAAAARQSAPQGLDAVLLTAGGEAAEKALAKPARLKSMSRGHLIWIRRPMPNARSRITTSANSRSSRNKKVPPMDLVVETPDISHCGVGFCF